MHYKKWLLILIAFCGLFLSGCTIQDETANMFLADETKILGEWYDQESKCFLTFYDNGSYVLGYDRNFPHAEGRYDLKNDSLYLTITHTIENDQRLALPAHALSTSQMHYRFNLKDNLVLRGEFSAFELVRVSDLNLSDTHNTTTIPIGLYMNVDGDTSYYFDKSGGVRFNDGLKTYDGTYVISGNTLQISFLESEHSFVFSFMENGNLILTDNNYSLTFKHVTN